MLSIINSNYFKSADVTTIYHAIASNAIPLALTTIGVVGLAVVYKSYWHWDAKPIINTADLDMRKDLNRPLPNEELPLHLAVCSNQPKIVEICLENEADPEVKDFQGLSAFDHAVLMQNQSMLVTILGKVIGKEFKEVQAQIMHKGSASHVSDLLNRIEKLSIVDTDDISSYSKVAAYRGDLSRVNRYNVNDSDSNGKTRMHYAILGNQKRAIDELIKLGADLKILDQDGNSYLHYAALSGSLDILNKFIDPEHLDWSNSSGQTPLHFASAKENLQFVKSLIKAGSDPTRLDSYKMSPLALFGATAYQRDPLSLPKNRWSCLEL